MNDYGHDYTDKELASLERQISKVYREAASSVQDEVNAYFQQFDRIDKEQKALVESGQLSESDYRQWRLTQIGRGQSYETLRERLAQRYVNADEVAIAYVNDRTPGIYTLNRNYTSYSLERSGAGVQFALWDESTVRRLLLENPNLMPHYPAARAVARGIDLQYGQEQITKTVTSSILQGKSVPKIANDLQDHIHNMSKTSATRAARTAMTNAENAGRQDQMEEAADMGIDVRKVWRCTFDTRTRKDHADADHQVVPYNEPFMVGGYPMMFPGDDSLGAPGNEIYNCRCRMITKNEEDLEVEPRKIRVRDPLTGRNVVVSDMTYKEWEAWAKKRMERNGDQG